MKKLWESFAALIFVHKVRATIYRHIKVDFEGIIMNTTIEGMDNIHSSTPCFYKPFNTKDLFIYKKKKETAIQYVYSMTYVLLKVCQCRIYKRHNLTLTRDKYLQNCTFLQLSYYI